MQTSARADGKMPRVPDLFSRGSSTIPAGRFQKCTIADCQFPDCPACLLDRPHTIDIGGLEWLEGTVPMPNGRVELSMDSDTIRIKSTAGNGTLRFRSTGTPSANGVDIKLTNREERYFEVMIQPNVEYIVRYVS